MDITDREAEDHEVERGEVEFDHVYFQYRKDAPEYILSDVSLKIPAGSTFGIIGQTGSAKSTLIQLIPRLYDATKGEVRIDGIPVKNTRWSICGTQLPWCFRRIRFFPAP